MFSPVRQGKIFQGLGASGGPLFPAAFSFYASGGILFVNSDKKYAKNAAKNQGFSLKGTKIDQWVKAGTG
jgi:hypothetical protein